MHGSETLTSQFKKDRLLQISGTVHAQNFWATHQKGAAEYSATKNKHSEEIKNSLALKKHELIQ